MVGSDAVLWASGKLSCCWSTDTPYFQLTMVPLCTTCMLVAIQTSLVSRTRKEEEREGTLATLSSRFVKALLDLSKPSHHPHEAAPFQDLWQRQALQCFQSMNLNLPDTVVLMALTRTALLISWEARQDVLTH